MEEIFTFLEDITKRLSRPIKDLDDIRHAMGSLREIRDREIMIDMSIGPIEVGSLKAPVACATVGIVCVKAKLSSVAVVRNIQLDSSAFPSRHHCSFSRLTLDKIH